MKEFTAEELTVFMGRNGAPVYAAYRGKVYDLSTSPLWDRGEHEASHLAGRDLTDEMGFAPHGDEVMGKFKVVGTLIK
jgi:predicted heme/steroid binding protein